MTLLSCALFILVLMTFFKGFIQYVSLLQTQCYDPFVLVNLTYFLFLECDGILFICDPLLYRIVYIGTLPYSCHFSLEIKKFIIKRMSLPCIKYAESNQKMAYI